MLKSKIIISIIGFYLFWLGAMPFVVSEAILTFCKNISHNTMYNIEVVNPKTSFSILPTAKLKAEKVLFSIDNKEFESEINNFNLNLRLLPLLSGKVHINSIGAENFYFSTSLEKNLELDKDFFNKIENTKFKIDKININEFKTQFYEHNIKTPITYSGKDLEFHKSNRYIKSHVDSHITVNDRVSIANINLFLPKNNNFKSTVFEIELSNLDISPLKNYLIHYLPGDLTKLTGIVNIKVNNGSLITELKDLGFIMNDKAKSIILPSLLTLKSEFNISEQAILIDNLEIESKNLHTIIKGKISNYLGKTKSNIDLKFLVKKAKIEDIVNILPPFVTEEFNIHKLKQYKFYGDSIANFTIKGRLPEPDINGEAYISNGILTKPIPNTIKGATLKLNFSGKHINYDVEVPAGKTERVWVKGINELYNIKYSDFTVQSTQNVDLHVAQTVLNPLHEILNFVIGPIPIMDINGTGNIDISVKGNRKNPHIWGILNFKNSDVKFKEIPDLKLTNSNSVLSFNNQDMTFTTKTGKLNGQDFSIKGTSNIQGKFDFDIETNNQPTELLYKALQTATLIPDIQKSIPAIDKIQGLTNIKLKTYGTVKDIKDLQIYKNAFAKGEIELINNDFTAQNITIEKTNGKISFDNTNAVAQIKAFIAELPLSIDAKVKNDIADLVLEIPKLNPNFLISDLETRAMQYLPYISVYGRYKGNINNIEYEKLNISSKILGSTQISKVKFLPEGEIIIANNNINAKGIKGYVSNPQNGFLANLKVTEAFSKKPITDGTLKIKTPDLTLFNEILASEVLPKNIRDYSKNFEFTKGAIDLNCKISSNKANLFTDLSGISFIYLPNNIPFEIINGTLSAKNNTLRLNKINLLADNMPILVDGDIKEIFDKQNFNLYINSKPQQEFIDKYINKNQLYPVKIKGDIVYWVKLKGLPDNYDLKVRIDMSKNSSIYHFGATLGDIENAIVISQDSKIINNNNVKIKEFSYDKLIDSQNGKKTELNLLKARGGVEILKDDMIFDDLIIKTSHPTDARIFNIIFRKPNIKQGQFTSDLKLNGKLSNPRIIGDFHIFETNIPFLDTSMKNIVLVFKDKIIEFESKGDILGNDVVFNGVMKNNLTKPYKIEKALLQTKDLNLNNIVNKIKIAEVDNTQAFESFENFKLTDLVTKNFKLKADNIQLRNILASNFEATTSLSEKGLFSVDDFHFNIAQGSLEGKYTYNLNNDKMSINLKADEISANDITWALFDLNNQIYGDMTGTVNLTCYGADFNKCMETLNGNTLFNVKNGKMPKLGSLEYLLKASNLVKGGFTGISLNNVIDLITPLKTGEFSDIYGSVRIKDGIAQNIEITSKGKDLSLFIGGTYNFATSMAEMEVLGLLSRKISTMFGPIGNLSINSVFNAIPGVDLTKDSPILERINKIPGIELSEKAYRKFIAEIKGNINGDDYVTSFKWIN